jgi:PP-loop superfamily ATP-utilizing enzyme
MGEVAAAFKAIGYTHATVDLEGYRRGSLNQGTLSKASPARESI